MLILAIETSCDETSAAVVEDGKVVHSNVISSQIGLHKKTGGVVPEVAARQHLENINDVVNMSVKESGKTWDDIDAIAVTESPGMINCLLIGTQAAATISKVKGKTLIPTNHIAGHIYANWLENEEEVNFPILILSVSGGHNDLILMKGHYDFELLGQTIDDAAGEAFDKVARMVGLPYPGGPNIEKMALNGDRNRFDFPRALLNKAGFDFSFSGLKTAVKNAVSEFAEDEVPVPDVCASFQEAVFDVFVKRVKKVLKKHKVKEIHLTGGVSANKEFRRKMVENFPDLKLRYPSKISYCTDNAAMIGAAAYQKHLLAPDLFSVDTKINADAKIRL